MNGRVTLCIIAAAALGVTGCGSAWQDATAQAVSQQCVTLGEELSQVPAGPNRARAQACLDACPTDAAAGRLGLMGAAQFGATLQQAIRDAAITDGESLGIEAAYREAIRG